MLEQFRRYFLVSIVFIVIILTFNLVVYLKNSPYLWNLFTQDEYLTSTLPLTVEVIKGGLS